MPDMANRLIATLLLLAIPCLGSDDDLVGLWKAKKRFGPDARGTLIVRRSGKAYLADMAGRVVPVSAKNRELAFALPDNGGTFRGRLDDRGIIAGHWYKPGSQLYSNDNGSAVSASPVRLEPDGPNRWRGTVDPDMDHFTFYLLLEKRPDGSFGALLRNPEFDLGTREGVERLVPDGNAVTLIGKRRGKEQDVAKGAYDPEAKMLRLDFPSRGGSYDFVRDGDDSAFYPRGRNPERYVYRPPFALNDGWPAGTLEGAGIDRPAIETFIQRILEMPMDSPDAPQFHGLLIARHGKLVLEEYFHGETRDSLHNVRSASKSLTAFVVGAAMQAGVPLKLDSPVYQVMNGGAFPADLEPQKKTMTLEHLLTMSAGYFCDDTNDEAPGNESTMWDQSAEPDFYRFIMRVPLATPPGENSVYCSAMPNLALGMAGRAAHENPMVLFDRLMGGPMKFRRYEWGLDRAGNPYGGGGMGLRLRDFAKLGQLMLNGGAWEGRRIVSREFAARAGAPLYHLRKINYGYFWWSEDQPYKDRMVRAISARGAGGQSITVIPELDLVVATFAGSFQSRKGMFAASTDITPRTILPAVREPGDDPRAPVVERDWVDPYGASKDGSRVGPPKP
ncbi:MAG TPA: serine hydrolase [Thermoanaerobaculia bacterium]